MRRIFPNISRAEAVRPQFLARLGLGGYVMPVAQQLTLKITAGTSRMHLVTPARLDHANYAATSELDRLGFCDHHVQAIEIRLVLFDSAYGLQRYGSSGVIEIPRGSLARLSHLWNGGSTSLRDLLRPEFCEL